MQRAISGLNTNYIFLARLAYRMLLFEVLSDFQQLLELKQKLLQDCFPFLLSFWDLCIYSSCFVFIFFSITQHLLNTCYLLGIMLMIFYVIEI